MEQTPNRYGNRISILGLWQPGEQFEYALAQGGFKGESYIKVMMNPIETQWHQLKSHEIAGQMFDNEYDDAIAIMHGMKARSEAGEYTRERFIFNCT